MPIIIRRILDDRFTNHAEIAADCWDLRLQIESLEAWLSSPDRRLDSSSKWVADLGFCCREDATGGGPPITRKLMQLCIEANLEIYLSEYGLDLDKKEMD